MKMQSTEAIAMAAFMFQGGSAARSQVSGLQLVLPEPDEVRHLQPGVQERARRGEHQQEADPELVLLEAGRDDHGLADEAAEEREGGDGQPADEREDKRPRHLLLEPAQLGELALAGHVQHRAAAHEEQALVEDVGEGVGAGAVDGHLRCPGRRRPPCSRPG